MPFVWESLPSSSHVNNQIGTNVKPTPGPRKSRFFTLSASGTRPTPTQNAEDEQKPCCVIHADDLQNVRDLERVQETYALHFIKLKPISGRGGISSYATDSLDLAQHPCPYPICHPPPLATNISGAASRNPRGPSTPEKSRQAQFASARQENTSSPIILRCNHGPISDESLSHPHE